VPSGSYGVDWWTDVRRHVERIRLTTSVCAAAEPAIRSFLGYRGPIAVVPSCLADPLANGAARATREPALDGVLVIGSAARLSAAKGFDVLIPALRLAIDRCPGRAVQLWIAGDGPERAALEARAAQLGLAANIRFLGHCGPAAMARFWAHVELFALASRWEGLPYAVVEAMAHGTPVIATAVDGVPEAVVDGATGLLVPADAVEPLAAALAALIASSERRAALGHAGRARFLSSFRSDVVVGRLLEAYRQALAGADARAGRR
jgi:glycosyltransferase involved in cell wall biosynthesis